MILLALLACKGRGDSDSDVGPPAVERLFVDCEVAGSEGIAVRISRPETPRHDGGTPVLVRVNPPSRLGYDEPFPDRDALDAGAAVVRFLDVGTAQDGQTSGGTSDGAGASRLSAIACVLSEVRTIVPEAGVVVLTGYSQGGNAAVMARVGADAVVLWEPPLVDQLVLVEPSPQGIVDPTFTEATCTLDGGCPFPGRAEALRWDPGESRIFHDLDGDGLLGEEPSWKPLPDEVNGTAGFLSLEMYDEIAANELAVFGGPRPAKWPSRIQTVQFWSSRDATSALKALRDGGGGRFLLVASALDHVQAFHEHERIALEAFAGAEWWRVNPDAAYSGAAEIAAGVEPDWSALPEEADAAMVLAAELEMADRAAHGDWSADLDQEL